MMAKIRMKELCGGITAISLLLISCSSEQPKAEPVPVAKVFDKILYLSDLKTSMHAGLSNADSAALAQTYIENWIKTQLILKKAELNLSKEQLDITAQLEAYRSSLIIYKYEEQMVREKVDTVVTKDQIEKYYTENNSSFLLNENIVKAVFIKVPLTAPDNASLKKWYKTEQKEDLKNLEKYCYAYANKYSDFDEDWISFAVIQKQLPELIVNEEEFLASNQFIEKEDNSFLYLVKIMEYKSKGTIAPIEYVKMKVKDIIINKRRLVFISELEKNIYNDAADHSNFKIYNLDKK
jgi:hypothetical protein